MVAQAIQLAQREAALEEVPFADCETILALKGNISSYNWCQLLTNNNGTLGIPYGTVAKIEDSSITLPDGSLLKFTDSSEVYFFIIRDQATKPKVRVMDGDWIIFSEGYALVLRPN